MDFRGTCRLRCVTPSCWRALGGYMRPPVPRTSYAAIATIAQRARLTRTRRLPAETPRRLANARAMNLDELVVEDDDG